MCLLLMMLALGPRVANVVWWFIAPGRWEAAFNNVVIPILGIVFLPWTTLMFVAVAPFGHVEGGDWWVLGLGFMLDIFSLASGSFGRARTPSTYP